jgi:hypothetical protein
MSKPQQRPGPGAAAAVDAAALSALPFPPHPPLAGSEAGSFAEGTIKTRLPAIMDTVLADLTRLAQMPEFASDEQQRQISAAAEGVKAMQAEMPADGRVTPLAVPGGSPPYLKKVVDWTNAAVGAWQQRGQQVRLGARGARLYTVMSDEA